MKIKNIQLKELKGVLLQLIETSDDNDEIEFLHEFIDKINKKIEGEKE